MLDDKFLSEILSETYSEMLSLPQYIISGSGLGWFFDPDACEMVRVSRGTEIIPLPDSLDDNKRMLVRAPHRFLLIPEKEVQEIGWN